MPPPRSSWSVLSTTGVVIGAGIAAGTSTAHTITTTITIEGTGRGGMNASYRPPAPELRSSNAPRTAPPPQPSHWLRPHTITHKSVHIGKSGAYTPPFEPLAGIATACDQAVTASLDDLLAEMWVMVWLRPWYGRSGIPARASLQSPPGTRPKQAMAGSTGTAAG
jgi:hypothetical protein